MMWHFFVVIGHCLSAVYSDECPAPFPCHCSRPPACYSFSPIPGINSLGCGKTLVDCGGASLNAIPQFEGTGGFYDMINLSGNNITRVGPNAFSNLSATGFFEIYLDSNPIVYIDDLAFAGLENTSLGISLRNTRLKALPNSLVNVNKLLSLTINGFESLDDHSIMRHLGLSLQTLDIGMQNMPSWPSELQFLGRLIELDIRGVPPLPEHPFYGFVGTLRHLSLDYSTSNDYSSIVYTKMTRSPRICHLYPLESINLESVHLFQADIISTCPMPLYEVRRVYLSFIDLVYFPKIFATFPRVSQITVTNTNLTHVDDAVIPSQNGIKVLNLAYNKLNRIPFAVKKMEQLQNLYLQFNEIESVEAHDLYNMPKLVHVYLQGNPIDFISEVAYMNSTSIQTLDLQDTELTNFPRAVLHLPNIQSISLDGTEIQCDCSLIWLSGWKRLKEVHITGRCSHSQETIAHYIASSLLLCDVTPVG